MPLRIRSPSILRDSFYGAGIAGLSSTRFDPTPAGEAGCISEAMNRHGQTTASHPRRWI